MEEKTDALETLRKKTEEVKAKTKESQEAIAEGKGILHLETPITARDEEIEELEYDFTDMTGLEYISVMDTDMNATQIFGITRKQALALFAQSAAKHTENLDAQDIMSRIGMTDAVIATQVATLFFSAAARAGRLRISKRL